MGKAQKLNKKGVYIIDAACIGIQDKNSVLRGLK
jgi:hypothetical protein